MNGDRERIGTWLAGWARARDVGVPVDRGACWEVEIGWLSQLRRYVFPLPSPELPRLARAIIDRRVYLKAFLPARDMAVLLPPGWVLEPQCQMMLLDILAVSPPICPAGYRLQQNDRKASILFDEGVVAEGQVVQERGLAVFVGIKVDPAHRRLGLGRAVMGALTVMAQDRGANHGALVATQEGAALYRSLGWKDHAPYISAHPGNIQR